MSNKRAYTIYLLMGAVWGLASRMAFTASSIYLVEIVGLNPLQLVLVGTAVELSAFIFEVPTGIIADAYSRRLSVIFGYLLLGVSFIIKGATTLFVIILGQEVLSGVGYTMISGALNAWIADEIGEEAVGKAYIRYGQVEQLAQFAGIGLGAVLGSWWLNVPLILAGILLIGLCVGLWFMMPETGFQPTASTQVNALQNMRNIFRAGVDVARQQPVVWMFLLVGVIFGAYSEGFDRLWEVHLLQNFSFPTIGNLKPIVWFGVIQAVSSLLNLAVAEALVRHLNLNDQTALAKVLLGANGLIIAGMLALSLFTQFWLVVVAVWLIFLMRSVTYPITNTWLSKNIKPEVRATVFSMWAQSDALGQMVGGPGIGWLATIRSLRVAMLASAVLLTPSLPLYGKYAVSKEKG